MSRRGIFWASVLLAGTALPQSISSKGPISAAEQDTALQAIREYAHNYTQHLPDYTCTQVTRRNTFPQRPALGTRALSDIITEQVSVVNHLEMHQVTNINGRAAPNVEHEQLPGGVSRGEFGTLLADIFDPATGTEFRFNRLASLNGRKMYVFDFSVPKSSGYSLEDGSRITRVPYKGTAYADYQTKAVMRIDMRCVDVPSSSEFRSLALTLDYKPARVAGQEFILPAHYLLRFRSAGSDAVNEAEYNDYRRFSAEATIKFDGVTQ